MKFLESDLEEIIYNTENELLQERGLDIEGLKLRQTRIGNYGIADIITIKKRYDDKSYGEYHPYLDITLFELKKDNINLSAFMQAVGYCRGIQRYMAEFYPSIEFTLNVKLVGKNIDVKSSFVYLPNLIDNYNSNISGCIVSLENYTYEYSYDGIRFEQRNSFSLIEENLKRR